LLDKHKGSLIRALSVVYHDRTWEPKKLPNRHWDDFSKQREFFDQLAEKLGIKTYSDWNAFRYTDIVKHKGGSILAQYRGSLSKALETLYPEHSWKDDEKTWKFYSRPSKAQRLAFKYLQEIFPDHRIYLDYKDPSLRYSKTQVSRCLLSSIY
jgi:hypothetical protein